MDITERMVDGVAVLDLNGRLILADGEELFRRKVDDLIARKQLRVLVNFQDVSYLDSAGVGALVWKYVTLRRLGGTLKVANLKLRSHRVLKTTRLLTVLENFDSEQEAVASFKS
jgi:stage II sporulation protein AA (anti-sigma F factor antagonist)